MASRARRPWSGVWWILIGLVGGGCAALLGREVTLPAGSAASEADRSVRMVTLLPRDAISAILDPRFLSGDAAEAQMEPSERVLGVSIAGDSRAYPVNVLSAVEIVNDTVGGVPLAVTY